MTMRFVYELVGDGLPPRAPESGDAGFDVFARFAIGLSRRLRPSETTAIPLGFRAVIPEGYHADLRPRSEWSSRGVHVAPVLDRDRGEWSAIVTNLGATPITIEHGAKIAQVVFVETVLPEVIEGEVSTDTRRGEGGFGSTGFGAPTDHHCDNCDGIQPETCINAQTLTPGDLVWWRGEWKVGEFRRYAEDEEQTAFPRRAPRAKVDFWDGGGWRFVLLDELSQPPPGRLMRLIRKAAGKTLGETARLMGVGVARLSGWEMCQTEPPVGDDLTKWFEAIEPIERHSLNRLKAVRDYIYEHHDQWPSPEPRPFAADTMLPDVSLPGEDPKQADARHADHECAIRPEHYRTDAPEFEPVRVIDDCGWGYGFAMGNVLKYVARAGRKGDALADYRKALYYAREATRVQGVASTMDRPDAGATCDAWGVSGDARDAVAAILADDPGSAIVPLERCIEALDRVRAPR